MGDLTREKGQQGIADAQSGTLRHTQEAWSVIENGPNRGDYVQKQARQKIFSEAKKTRYLEAQHIPDPQTTLAEPSQVVGEPDLGDVTAKIDAKSYASIQINTGSVETYIKDQGFIRRWVTEDKYDIYA